MDNNITKMLIKQKPATIKAAIALLSGGIVLGLINGIIWVSHHSGIQLMPFVIVSLCIFLFQIILIYTIAKGSSWGRIILVILTVSGFIIALTGNEKLVFWMNGIGIIDSIAIVSLFMKQSNAWFTKISNSRK
jgi:hypothetical protein